MTAENVHALIGKSLRSRAMMANALCAIAEEEFHAGQLVRAAETVHSIRAVLAGINILLSGDTSYFPYGTLRDTSELLAGLDGRIRTMEAAMRIRTVH